MKTKQTKRYLCVVCGKKEIIESRTRDMYEGPIPDISTCDFSDYSNYRIKGGKLLENRPDVNWESSVISSLKKMNGKDEQKPPIGGICNDCLKEQSVQKLVKGGHILFDEDEAE